VEERVIILGLVLQVHAEILDGQERLDLLLVEGGRELLHTESLLHTQVVQLVLLVVHLALVLVVVERVLLQFVRQEFNAFAQLVALDVLDLPHILVPGTITFEVVFLPLRSS